MLIQTNFSQISTGNNKLRMQTWWIALGKRLEERWLSDTCYTYYNL
jgi:hypothetical protein